MTEIRSNIFPTDGWRGMRRWLGRTGLAAMMVTAMGGCYSYQPVDGPVPVGDEIVRIRLTGAGEDNMQRDHGLAMEGFEGRVVDESGQSVTVEARLPANLLAFGDQEFTDTLQVPRADIRTVDVKKFSTGRTVAGVAGGLAVLGGIYAIVRVTQTGNSPGGDGDGQVFSLIPIISTVTGWLR